MSAIDPNLAPVLVIPSGGGASLPDDPAAVLLDVASPSTLVGLDAAGVGAALSQASARAFLGLGVVPPLTGTTGWTLRSGVGGATVTSSVLRLTLPATTPPGSWTNQPAASYPQPVTGTLPCFAVDFDARLAALTGGDSSDVYLSASLRTGAGATATGLVFNVRGDGGAIFGYGEGVSTGTVIGSGTIARGSLAGGQFWMRVTLFGDTIYFRVGTGSGGARPTAWTLIGSTNNTTGISPTNIGAVVFALDAGGGGSPTDVTADWRDISVRLAGLAP